MPSEQCLEAAPIHLNFDHEVVRSFLDIFHIASSTGISVDLSFCKELLAISDMLGTPGIERFLMGELRQSFDPHGDIPPLNAWDAFKIAAARNDTRLAKAAIRCFELSGHNVRRLLLGQSPAFFDDIPPRYIYALMRASFDPTPCPDHRSQFAKSKESSHTREAIHVRTVAQIAYGFTLD